MVDLKLYDKFLSEEESKINHSTICYAETQCGLTFQFALKTLAKYAYAHISPTPPGTDPAVKCHRT